MSSSLNSIGEFVSTFKWLLKLWNPQVFAKILVDIPVNQSSVISIKIEFVNRTGLPFYKTSPVCLYAGCCVDLSDCSIDYYETLFKNGNVKKTTNIDVRELYNEMVFEKQEKERHSRMSLSEINKEKQEAESRARSDYARSIHPVFNRPKTENSFDSDDLPLILNYANRFKKTRHVNDFPEKELVYFISNHIGVKIGYTSNFKKRIKDYTKYSKDIHIHGYIEGGRDLESDLHRIFSFYNCFRREWFNNIYVLKWFLDGDIQKIEHYSKKFNTKTSSKTTNVSTVKVNNRWYIAIRGKINKRFSTGFGSEIPRKFPAIERCIDSIVADIATESFDESLAKYKVMLKAR